MIFKQIIAFFCVMVILEVGVMFSMSLWLHHTSEAPFAKAKVMEPAAKKSPVRSERAEDLRALMMNTEGILGSNTTRTSVYFIRPQREIEPYIHNSVPMSPASMIKLFVMAKVMQDVHDGRLSLTDEMIIKESDVVDGAGVTYWYHIGEKRSIKELLTIMITDSDNTATNMLIDKVGIDSINRYIQQNGYTDTVLAHKMMIWNGGQKTFSSTRDIGHLLTKLYYHVLVGEKEDDFMIEILKQQHDRECFPMALPDYEIAHKTGEVTDVYCDGGIFYGVKDDFVLVIMAEQYIERSEILEQMQKLARYYANT